MRRAAPAIVLALLVASTLLAPPATAFHPPWDPVTWWGHSDRTSLWVDRVQLDPNATQQEATRSVTTYAQARSGSPADEGSVAWEFSLQRGVNETLQLSPGGNLTIVAFFSARTGEVPDGAEPASGQPLPSAGDVRLSAAVLLDGEVAAQAPAQAVTANAAWQEVRWRLANPISTIHPDQEAVLRITATGPATNYRLGLSSATGHTHVELPVVRPTFVPVGDLTRAVATGWQANLSLAADAPTNLTHIVHWTGPARVEFQAHVETVQGRASIIVQDATGTEVRRGGSVGLTMLDGAAGPWNITVVASSFIGNISWRIEDIDGPPPEEFRAPPPPPPPAPPQQSSTPPLEDLPEDALPDGDDKEAPGPAALLVVGLVLLGLLRRRT